jgi:hypothetical protein
LSARWAGRLISDGDGVYYQWVHVRQSYLGHLIRRVLAELPGLVHWAMALPTAGDVQTWYARMVRLLNQHSA